MLSGKKPKAGGFVVCKQKQKVSASLVFLGWFFLYVYYKSFGGAVGELELGNENVQQILLTAENTTKL